MIEIAVTMLNAKQLLFIIKVFFKTLSILLCGGCYERDAVLCDCHCDGDAGVLPYGEEEKEEVPAQVFWNIFGVDSSKFRGLRQMKENKKSRPHCVRTSFSD